MHFSRQERTDSRLCTSEVGCVAVSRYSSNGSLSLRNDPAIKDIPLEVERRSDCQQHHKQFPVIPRAQTESDIRAVSVPDRDRSRLQRKRLKCLLNTDLKGSHVATRKSKRKRKAISRLDHVFCLTNAEYNRSFAIGKHLVSRKRRCTRRTRKSRSARSRARVPQRHYPKRDRRPVARDADLAMASHQYNSQKRLQRMPRVWEDIKKFIVTASNMVSGNNVSRLEHAAQRYLGRYISSTASKRRR